MDPLTLRIAALAGVPFDFAEAGAADESMVCVRYVCVCVCGGGLFIANLLCPLDQLKRTE